MTGRTKVVMLNYFLMVAVLFLAACGSPASLPEPDIVLEDGQVQEQETYVLTSGDTIKITVFNDEALSGDYHINSLGYITMPLIGTVKANGVRVADLQSDIEHKLGQGYLVKPRVSIDVVSLRPFYIRGEVQEPGSYPAVPGLDVFQAIATAGGLTPRARKDDYILIRGSGKERKEYAVRDDTPVYPGDSINVKERFF